MIPNAQEGERSMCPEPSILKYPKWKGREKKKKEERKMPYVSIDKEEEEYAKPQKGINKKGPPPSL